MSNRVISVSQLVRYLKSKLDGDPLIQKIQIEGEISNFTAHRSGHWYFTLKDSGARISCVMFQTYARSVKFVPKNGDQVVVMCSTSVFESAGQLQLYCTAMKPYGTGDLYVQLELLKEKLRSEGLFAQEHKKKLPAYPMKIGVIVGANTAARKDICTTLKRRWPIAQIEEFHSLVQGETAHLELIAALLRADAAECDVLILARGGGSIEDLWAFNNEQLARYIYQLKTPLVSGIGHEVDFTIADFVADVRAATPTAAAETVSPEISEVALYIDKNQQRLEYAMNQQLVSYKKELAQLKQRNVFTDPVSMLNHRQMRVDGVEARIQAKMNSKLQEAQKVRSSVAQFTQMITVSLHEQLRLIDTQTQKMESAVRMNLQKQSLLVKHAMHSLDAYSPLKILLRGYSIATIQDQAITSIEQVHLNDVMNVRVADGNITCSVKDKGELS